MCMNSLFYCASLKFLPYRRKCLYVVPYFNDKYLIVNDCAHMHPAGQIIRTMFLFAMTIGHALLAALILMEFRVSSIDLRFLRNRTESVTKHTTAISAPTTTLPETNCTEGVWSEWQEVLSCNADCGSCGSRVFRRKCTTDGCVCRGDLRKEERCNIQVCEYPKPACCPPFKLMVIKGEFACGPQDENSLAAFETHLKGKPHEMTLTPSLHISGANKKGSKSDPG
ncbi:hypothetical protein RB195_006990 [Necator americanus]|uniref:Thrombospondin type 1 domain protein n=1 Tax=Necator americanus TaxID=51031 RepID=A0ABR1BY10_NECAM